VAIPKRVKVAIAGTAGDKFNKGPSRVGEYKTEIATKFRAVWLMFERF